MTGRCTIDGCGRPHVARGWCRAHYLRWCRHGDPRPDVPVLVRDGTSRQSLLRRARAERGPAAARSCARCGGQAWCWTTSGDGTSIVPSCRSCLRLTGARVDVDVERAARLYRAGVTARAIAAVLGVGTTTLLRALRANGVDIRYGGRRPRRNVQADDAENERHLDLDAQPTDEPLRRPARLSAPAPITGTSPTSQGPKSNNQTIAS